jgi:hypothetical protein
VWIEHSLKSVGFAAIRTLKQRDQRKLIPNEKVPPHDVKCGRLMENPIDSPHLSLSDSGRDFGQDSKLRHMAREAIERNEVRREGGTWSCRKTLEHVFERKRFPDASIA